MTNQRTTLRRARRRVNIDRPLHQRLARALLKKHQPRELADFQFCNFLKNWGFQLTPEQFGSLFRLIGPAAQAERGHGGPVTRLLASDLAAYRAYIEQERQAWLADIRRKLDKAHQPLNEDSGDAHRWNRQKRASQRRGRGLKWN